MQLSVRYLSNNILFKGLSPIVGVMLLALITVGLVGTTYTWIHTMTGGAQNETGGLIEHQFDVMGANLKIDVSGNCKIYLRNTGTKDVPIEVIGFYAAEPGSEAFKPLVPSPETGTIKKNAVQGLDFSATWLSTGVKYKLMVKIYGNTMDWSYLTCGGAECTDDSECSSDGCSGIRYFNYSCNLAINQCESRSYDCSYTDENTIVPASNNNLSIACNCNCGDYDEGCEDCDGLGYLMNENYDYGDIILPSKIDDRYYKICNRFIDRMEKYFTAYILREGD